MSEQILNRDELLQDSQATLRQVASILTELWNLEEEGIIPSRSEPGADGGCCDGHSCRQDALCLKCQQPSSHDPTRS